MSSDLPEPAEKRAWKRGFPKPIPALASFLDFGGAAAPEHKIRRVGDYLMVFLGDWTPKAAPPKKTAAAPPIPARPPQVVRPKPNPPTRLALDSSGLTIKSVEVVDGVIVLQVANRTKPAGNYRIDLGINFDQLGFSVANVQPNRRVSQTYSPRRR